MRLVLILFLFFPCLVFSQVPRELVPKEADQDLVKDSQTEINVKNADIEALVRIFSKKTKRNYILDERVKGTVSIYLPGKISSQEAIYILDSVLALKGFTSVPIGDNLWKIIPAQEAKQTTVPIVDEPNGRGSPSVVTRFINLSYVSAEDARELVSSLVSSYGLVSAYTGTNSLILIDSEDNIHRLTEIIKRIDLPASDSEMVIIPVNYAEAADLVEKIKDILGVDTEEKNIAVPTSVSASDTLASRRARRTSTSKDAPAAPSVTSLTVSMKPRDPKIIADERTNSIIVVADEEMIARIKALAAQLDSPIDLSGGNFFVYRCQHASAEELAEVLSGLVDGGGGLSTSDNNTTSSSSTRRTSARADQTARSQDRIASQRRTPGRSRNEGQTSSGISSLNLGDEISITADPSTNSLIIAASRGDYEKIKELLKRLDIKRRQVVVEALILEVGVDDSISTSSEFSTSSGGSDGGVFASNNYGNLGTLLSDPSGLQDLTLAAASAGTLTLPGGITIPTHTLLVRAAENNTNVNVLSSPTITATDNEEAEIVVGANIPFISSTASNQSDLNNVFNQVDRQDVGITLRITPQISSSDFVTLNLFTEVSNVIPGTENSELGPATTVRTSETTVIAKDSQMIVTGGLISDDITLSERGIPYLKDVPIIGNLFKTVIETQERTNLLIFITPKIVKDQFDARDVSVQERDEIQEVIESYQIYPDRGEQLASPNFDNVIEGRIYEGTKPSTIRGEPKQLKPKEQAMSDISNLPEIKTPTTETARLKQPIETPGMALASKYVVLEMQGELPSGVWPEMIALANEDLVGIAIPQGANNYAKKFFQSGGQYNYTNGSEQVSLQVIGLFDQKSEAEKYYPSFASKWYVLSPHEILNLGSGPWLR